MRPMRGKEEDDMTKRQRSRRREKRWIARNAPKLRVRGVYFNERTGITWTEIDYLLNKNAP